MSNSKWENYQLVDNENKDWNLFAENLIKKLAKEHPKFKVLIIYIHTHIKDFHPIKDLHHTRSLTHTCCPMQHRGTSSLRACRPTIQGTYIIWLDISDTKGST
jgi:predicted metal-dependent hydrolase